MAVESRWGPVSSIKIPVLKSRGMLYSEHKRSASGACSGANHSATSIVQENGTGTIFFINSDELFRRSMHGGSSNTTTTTTTTMDPSWMIRQRWMRAVAQQRRRDGWYPHRQQRNNGAVLPCQKKKKKDQQRKGFWRRTTSSSPKKINSEEVRRMLLTGPTMLTQGLAHINFSHSLTFLLCSVFGHSKKRVDASTK
eukprot:scaffold8363_cov163-Amphora_coffeaeformis.AAC.9